jgi:hypothetical protein
MIPLRFLLLCLGVFVLSRAASVAPAGAAEDPPKRGKAVAEIVSPRSGQEVDRRFTLRAKTTAIPTDGHLWAASLVGDLLWPKEPELSVRDNEASATIGEGGAPADGKFSVVLLLVGKAGQEAIEKWLEQGRTTGDFPGLKIEAIPGAQRLDTVTVKLRDWAQAGPQTTALAPAR